MKVRDLDTEATKYLETQLTQLRKQYPTAKGVIDALEAKGVPCADVFADRSSADLEAMKSEVRPVAS